MKELVILLGGFGKSPVRLDRKKDHIIRELNSMIMKKITITFLALSIFSLSFAQDNQEDKQKVDIDKSKLQFNAVVGLSTWGIPFYIGADYWITEDITAGVEASFRYRLLHSYRYGYIGGSVNANYHVNRLLELPEEIDLYGGLSAGPYIAFGNYYSGANLRIHIGGQVGGRYKVSDNLWIHGELGGGIFSGGKIGVTLRR